MSVRMVVLVLAHSQHRRVLVGKLVRGDIFLGITRKGTCGLLVALRGVPR